MNIGIDIDDTLTNSFDYFMPYVAEYFGVSINELKEKKISYGNLPEEWKKDEVGFCQTYYDQIVPMTPFKKDAVWGIEKLRELGHKIIIITARSYELYTDPYQTTKQELMNGQIVYDQLICTMNKAQACIQENISVLIDDHIGNCLAANQQGIAAIVFNSAANLNEQVEWNRVSNWHEAIMEIENIERGYPDCHTAEELLLEAEKINPGAWGNHCRVAAQCAKKIAKVCAMDDEKAYVLGILHDIGRKFLVRDLGHVYYGYQYMQRLGYHQVARVCLTHSFLNQDLDLYIGKLDIPYPEVEEVKTLLQHIIYDDYDRLIQLCDALAGSEGVIDIEERMADVKQRYGNYPQAQWDKNIELKSYFETKARQNIYDIVSDK
ncbi:HD domain-containing protein [Candidatus Stoquefichus massiliensis]|uniref:HD domain-containing protein n=1 Tax=Candidatus Stoquefichus massiliensis TaxID=1470350 RepID=UPI0004BA9F8A|nr:HD domain-containing protein [Candidatus Stoquefichus massiliensis]